MHAPRREDTAYCYGGPSLATNINLVEGESKSSHPLVRVKSLYPSRADELRIVWKYLKISLDFQTADRHIERCLALRSQYLKSVLRLRLPYTKDNRVG